MRYALPVSNGKVAGHFGYCEYFALIDVDEASNTITRKELVASPGHQPGVLPVWLAEEGASAVIAGGMGSRAQTLFAENHIQVVIGAPEEDPEKVVMDFIQGALTTDNNVCDH